jgi:hypothetical protein
MGLTWQYILLLRFLVAATAKVFGGDKLLSINLTQPDWSREKPHPIAQMVSKTLRKHCYIFICLRFEEFAHSLSSPSFEPNFTYLVWRFV